MRVGAEHSVKRPWMFRLVAKGAARHGGSPHQEPESGAGLIAGFECFVHSRTRL